MDGWSEISGGSKFHRYTGTVNMIKILRIIARLNIGGPAIHVHLLTKGLDKKQFQSTLVTGSISPEEGDMNYLFDSEIRKPVVIPELQREIRLFADMKVLFALLKVIKGEAPDIVHTHTAKAGTIGRFAVLIYNLFRSKKVKLVHTFHGHVFEGYFGEIKSRVFIGIERFLASHTDRIIAISANQKRELSEKYCIAPPGKVDIIPLGFDLVPFFSANTRKGRFRKMIHVGQDPILIGIVGRLVPIKDHEMFLQGAKRLMENHPTLDVKFAVIGDGELRSELEAHCKREGLQDTVIFCGWIADVSGVYADLDILALTSDNEGTPVSIIEAMASSVPVIATDVGGITDLMGPVAEGPVREGFLLCERGILCEKKDPIGFSDGLKHIIEEGKIEKGERIKRARRFVEENYSEARLLKDVASLYTLLISEDTN